MACGQAPRPAWRAGVLRFARATGWTPHRVLAVFGRAAARRLVLLLAVSALAGGAQLAAGVGEAAAEAFTMAAEAFTMAAPGRPTDALWADGLGDAVVNGELDPPPNHAYLEALWFPESLGYLFRDGLELVSLLADFCNWLGLLLFFRVILTWFSNVNWEVEPLLTLRVLTDPYLNIFRRLIPNFMGTFDITPILGYLMMQWIHETLDWISTLCYGDSEIFSWLTFFTPVNEDESLAALDPWLRTEQKLNPNDVYTEEHNVIDDVVEAYVDSEPEEAAAFPENMKGFWEQDGDEELVEALEGEGFQGFLGRFTLPVDELGAEEAERDLHAEQRELLLDQIRRAEEQGVDLDKLREDMQADVPDRPETFNFFQ